MPELDLDDVQGNILHGYGQRFPAAEYAFYTTPTPAAARGFLRAVADLCTSGRLWERGREPDWTVNVALTFAGFRALGLPEPLLSRFPDWFRVPTLQRVDRLGDDVRADPWEDPLGTGAAEILITTHGRSVEDLTQLADRLAELAGAWAGVERVYRQPAAMLVKRREHFGYSDGFSQPEIEGVTPRGSGGSSKLARGALRRDGTWRPLRTGEFLLGYPDEDGHVTVAPSPDLVRNGSYVVWRKLHQDVATFDRALTAGAELLGLDEELLAAKILGRWRDGTALMVSQEDDGRRGAEHESSDPSNDFRYLPDDPAGHVCPVGAHIRRTNPRDALSPDGKTRYGSALSDRHRIIRRGMPYGPPLRPGTEEEDRGLVFVCYNADIARQFEIIQSQWCNDGDAFGLGADADWLLGVRGSAKMTIEGLPPRFLPATDGLVVARGTEYLLAPGMGALRGLAAGRFSEDVR
jgi:Dyp-type peroxidase family